MPDPADLHPETFDTIFRTAVYIETFGCQMNRLDSELVMGVLAAEGFAAAPSPDEAGIVLFNTCSVREHAAQRVYGRLAALKRRVAAAPGGLIVGVLGCLAQQEGGRIFERCPWVRVVCGPTHLDQLPQLLRRALAGYERIEAVSADIRAPSPAWDPPRRSADSICVPRPASSGHVPLALRKDPAGQDRPGHTPDGIGGALSPHFQRFVRIMRGCDNFCAYCIVPFVRGPEQSRPADEIVDEVRRLVDTGCREVTLLGQNVNAYASPGRGRAIRLPGLLERLNAIEGLFRIRFVTSHPKDLTDDILDAMARLDKVCEHLHLPAQAGSDTELARMNRRYTRADYLGIVERARRRMPDIGLVSDFIVGFPGETDEEYQATRALVAEVHYKNCFIFKYSPRPGTAAARMADEVPDEVKQARLADLLAVQRTSAEADHRTFVGRRVEILVEGPSKAATKQIAGRAASSPLPRRMGEGEGWGEGGGLERPAASDRGTIQLVGRTRSDHIVVFDGPPSLAGRLVTVHITDSTDLTLFGWLGG